MSKKQRSVKKSKTGKVDEPRPATSKSDASASEQKLSRKEYDRELRQLHVELVKLQEWVVQKGQKVCVLFEGRDGAGKGGTIKALTERVSPRVFRVVALPAPTEREQSQMYIQRYLPHLPAAGEIVIFDRSWYNRAGVERVMGFCTEEQSRRLKNRIDDGRKVWKLSPMDIKSYDRWDDYTKARDEMFAATDTAWAPWYVARSEDKKRVRLNVISHFLKQVPYKSTRRAKVKLPKRKIGRYKPTELPLRYVPEVF